MCSVSDGEIKVNSKQPIIAHQGIFHELKKRGLIPDHCRRVVIDIEVGNVVKVFYECYGDERLIEVLTPENLKPVIKYGKNEHKEKP